MGACCFDIGVSDLCLDTNDEGQCWFAGGTFIPEATCAMYDCEHNVARGACCLTDGTCVPALTMIECFDMGQGLWQGEYTTCEESDCQGVEPEPPEDCIYARSDRVPTRGYPWNLDLCQNAVFSVSGNSETGHAEPMSKHPIRAMAQPAGQEPCRYHAGKLTVRPNGYAVASWCSQPTYGDVGTRQGHWGRLWAENGLEPIMGRWGREPEQVIRTGYACFVGSYHAPYWTEAQYRSPALICQIPV